MNEDDIKVPVYLITGFLEGGKTSFIRKVLGQRYFQIPGVTTIINTESGEEEYDSSELTKSRAMVVDIDDESELTAEKLEQINNDIYPERVMIELNPLWGVKKFEELTLPEGWGIVQKIVLVDAGTYQVYQNNMKSLFSEMFTSSDLVIFNRCKEDMPLANFRRGIKVVDPACEVVFEGPDGQMMDLFEEAPPYDLDADVVNIEDVDYGIFYVDLHDHPERYVGKTVHFRGLMKKSKAMGSKYFALGWMAMTCCADDIQFIGYICETPKARGYEDGTWVEITAKVEIKHMMAYRGKGPIFRVMQMAPVEPPESELVYFN